MGLHALNRQTRRITPGDMQGLCFVYASPAVQHLSSVHHYAASKVYAIAQSWASSIRTSRLY